jgi:hypothetical protein
MKASRLGLLTAGKEPPVPIGYGCGCALDPVWAFWRRQKFALPKLETLKRGTHIFQHTKNWQMICSSVHTVHKTVKQL